MISFIFKAMFSENAHHLGNFQLNVLIFLGLIELMGRDSCLPLVYCIYLPSLSITELTDFYVSTCVCVLQTHACERIQIPLLSKSIPPVPGAKM